MQILESKIHLRVKPTKFDTQDSIQSNITCNLEVFCLVKVQFLSCLKINKVQDCHTIKMPFDLYLLLCTKHISKND